MKDHPHHDRVEPALLERQRLRARDPGVHSERLRALDHRRGGVERPDPSALPLLERLGEPPGAAADLEDALAAQPAEPYERVEDLPPVRVDRPQLLVARGAAVEPADGGLRHVAGACSRARSGCAPPLTSTGSPRSGNGSSTTSKSRGRTGAGNTSRASRSSSEPRYRGETCVSASSPTPAARDLGGLVSGGVAGVDGAIAVFLGERRLVDQQLGARESSATTSAGACHRCRRPSVRAGDHRRGPRAAPSSRRRA